MTAMTANFSTSPAPTRGARPLVGGVSDGMTAFRVPLFSLCVCVRMQYFHICCHAVMDTVNDWNASALTCDGLTVIVKSQAVINREVSRG